MRTRRLAPLLAALALAAAPSPGSAQPCSNGATGAICDGQVLVVDLTGNRVIRVDPVTGVQQQVPTGGSILFPRSLVADRNGHLFVSMNDGIVKATPDANRQGSVISGFDPGAMQGIAQAPPGGNLYAAVPGASSPLVDRVTRVDPVSGLFFIVAEEELGFPFGVAADPCNGVASPPCSGTGTEDVLVVDLGSFVDGSLRRVAVLDPTTGDMTTLTQSGLLATPRDVAAAGIATLYVTDSGGNAFPQPPPDENTGPTPVARPPQVLAIDRTQPFDPAGCPVPLANPDLCQNQRVVAKGGRLVTPIGIAVEADGKLLVVDAEAQGGALIRIDPATYNPSNLLANQTILSKDQLFGTPWDIHIVSGVAPVPHPTVYVTETGATGASPGVLRLEPDVPAGAVAPTDWDVSPVFEDDPYLRPVAVAVEPCGCSPAPCACPDLVVADADAAAVFRQPAAGGAPTLIAQGGFLEEPADVRVDADGTWLVTDRGPTASLIRIDPSIPFDPGNETANQVRIAPPSNPDLDHALLDPIATTHEPNGRLLVVDLGRPAAPAIEPSLIEISPDTGRQVCIATLTGGAEGAVLDADGTIVFSVDSATPVFRVEPTTVDVKVESVSTDYQTPRKLAIDARRDILVADAGLAAPGDGQVLLLDPSLNGDPDALALSPGGALDDPSGIAVDGVTPPAPVYAPPPDADADGVNDEDDNCLGLPNPDQADANRDGVGDACDCDASGDRLIGLPDFAILTEELGNICTGDPLPISECRSDCTADSAVGLPDFNVMLARFGNAIPTGARTLRPARCPQPPPPAP